MGDTSRITIVIADDHPVVREGLRSMLELNPRVNVVAEATDGVDLIRKVAECDPDVVLLDIRMPEMGGLDVVRRLQADGCRSRLVVMTAYDEEEYMLEAVRAGVHGYLLKEIDGSALNSAIEAVLKGEIVLDPRVEQAFTELLDRGGKAVSVPDWGLTAREQEVLELLYQGLSNQQIAKRLFISMNTLKFHLKNIYRKLGVSSRLEAIKKLTFG